MKNSYYFLHTKDKKVEVFKGGLFIFPVRDGNKWEQWINGTWRKPTNDYTVKCHLCRSRFNLVHHKEGLLCGADYRKHFCDESCRMRWHRKKNEGGSLHIWNKTLWDIRYCVWLWEG